jgi:hypothetical protein
MVMASLPQKKNNYIEEQPTPRMSPTKTLQNFPKKILSANTTTPEKSTKKNLEILDKTPKLDHKSSNQNFNIPNNNIEKPNNKPNSAICPKTLFNYKDKENHQ